MCRARAGAPGVAKVYKLSSNETPLGPSPEALEAYDAAAGSSRIIRTAPDARSARPSAGPGLDPDRIVCGAGSDDLLTCSRTAICPRRRGDLHQAWLLVYPIAMLGAARSRWGAGEEFHRRRRRHPRRDEDQVVFLANPNNPTGTYMPFDEIRRLHAGLPPHVILVLDAAYAEYVRRNDYAAGIELVATTKTS